jgi:glycosyltransferase involved in cell wall biosynthesis
VLTVLVNAVSVPPRPAGAGRYAIELLRALSDTEGVRVLAAGPPWLRAYGIPLALEAPAAGAPARTAWELSALPWRVRKMEYDVYHGTHFTVPPGLGRPTVATVHDLTFYLLPRRYDAVHRWYYRVLAESAARADRIIVPSRSVAEAFAERFPLTTGRIRVVPEAPSAVFRPASDEEVAEALARHGVEPPYLLCVGTGEPNKRAVDAVRALPLLLEQGLDCRLALAGNPGRLTLPLAREAERLGVGGRVRFLGYVTDDDLRALYTGAVALVFPSLVEGFGLPPLEAMACGTPVISTDAPAMNEVLRGAAIFVPRRNPTAIAEAAARLLREPSWREEWAGRARDHAAAFSWQRTAAETAAVYREVAGR